MVINFWEFSVVVTQQPQQNGALSMSIWSHAKVMKTNLGRGSSSVLVKVRKMYLHGNLNITMKSVSWWNCRLESLYGKMRLSTGVAYKNFFVVLVILA